MIKIGLVQAEAISDAAKNFESLSHFVKSAADLGCEAVCFPECFLTGYHPEGASEEGFEIDNALLSQTLELAKTHRIDILAGFMERSHQGAYITHGIFRRDGGRAFYRKTHLGQKEARFFRAGSELSVYSLSCGLKIGFQLCVETHYPEITQTLALKGAEVIFAPHAIPRVSGDRQTVWGKYITARSYDNRVYMACCNLYDDSRFGGGCLVTDPRGEVAAQCFDEAPSLLTCEVDPALVARYRTPSDKRSTHYYPGKRRPELYRVK